MPVIDYATSSWSKRALTIMNNPDSARAASAELAFLRGRSMPVGHGRFSPCNLADIICVGGIADSSCANGMRERRLERCAYRRGRRREMAGFSDEHVIEAAVEGACGACIDSAESNPIAYRIHNGHRDAGVPRGLLGAGDHLRSRRVVQLRRRRRPPTHLFALRHALTWILSRCFGRHLR